MGMEMGTGQSVGVMERTYSNTCHNTVGTAVVLLRKPTAALGRGLRCGGQCVAVAAAVVAATADVAQTVVILHQMVVVTIATGFDRQCHLARNTANNPQQVRKVRVRS